MVAEIVAPFSYSSVAIEAADELKAVASRIKQRHRTHVEAAIGTGRDLIRAKELLGHGSFLPWLEAEFRWTERTARTYMAISECFDGKSEIIADLGIVTASLLAAKSTPTEARDLVVSRLAAGERLDPSEIKHIVQDAKPERKHGKATGAVSNLQRKRMKEWERENEERELRVRDGRARALAKQAAEIIIAMLGDRVDDVAALLRDADMNHFRSLIVQ